MNSDEKVLITLENLSYLKDIAIMNGTEIHFIELVLQWAGEAQKEILRLRKLLDESNERSS